MEWIQVIIAGFAALGIELLVYFGIFAPRRVRAHMGGETMSEYERDEQFYDEELEKELHSQNELSGVVESVIFHNEKNGYAVFRMTVDGEDKTVTVVGTFPYLCAGEGMWVEGTWTHHASYGEQFKAERAERTLPADSVSIIRYLSSGNLPGIGPATAKRLVERFGRDVFDVLENSAELVAEVPGMTRAKAEKISDAFHRQTGIRRLMESLLVYGINPEVALRLYRWYGELAEELIRQNPYILSREEVGVDFASADGMAIDLGFPADAPVRVEAGVLYELEHNSHNGHVFIPADKLCPATAQLLGVPEELATEAVDRLVSNGAVVREEIGGTTAVYLSGLHEAELDTAARLRLMAMTPPEPPRDLEQMLERISEAEGVEYAPLQREAIRVAATERVMLLTGGPGTGKSTSVRGMLSVFDRMGLDTRLASPTGRAAKRLSELTGRDATTVHRMLEVDFSAESAGFSFVHDAENPLTADVVVLDECSMVDLPLFAALVEALRPDARLVLVGDPDQLPSVGPGSVLADLLSCGAIKTVRLTEIFRQAQSSNIVMAAHSVNRGEVPPLRHKSGDLYFVKRWDAAEAADTVVDLCTRRLPSSMGFEPSQIQVLSPTRRGAAGTAELNRKLQAALNPPSKEKPERRSGEFTFRRGDRVMHIHNNYDLVWRSTTSAESGMGVFNGDVGVIEEIDTRAETLVVRYDDRWVTYPFELLEQLEPAYAMTVHKSQGSEYPAVVLLASDASPRLLTRPVFYTAITRAQQLLVIVGDEGTITAMVQNNRRRRRYSGLRARMEE